MIVFLFGVIEMNFNVNQVLTVNRCLSITAVAMVLVNLPFPATATKGSGLAATLDLLQRNGKVSAIAPSRSTLTETNGLWIARNSDPLPPIPPGKGGSR